MSFPICYVVYAEFIVYNKAKKLRRKKNSEEKAAHRGILCLETSPENSFGIR